MSFVLLLMIGANSMTTCAPPAGGHLTGPMAIGTYHASVCYQVKRRPHLTTIA